ncbi:hypothetical protein V9T40_006016 [Parthenolecanium corni]|uniref:Transposable element P transposase-like GTP-binding insertion domain-containing protein n=1 Tax=Parthenolecanium corni TaxID=536013 RepID=A0AAN9TTL3_9HEMI
MPYLLKSLRNNFLIHDFQYLDKIARFDDIQKTYDIDVKNDSAQALRRITKAHLEPDNFAKMSVKLAAQLFSPSVSLTIRTVLQTGESISPPAKHTASFVELVNDVFDILNSRQLFHNNPLKTALTKSASNKSFDIFKKTSQCFINLKQLVNKNHKGCMVRPYCFNGLVQTINGVLELFENEKDEADFSHFLTN